MAQAMPTIRSTLPENWHVHVVLLTINLFYGLWHTLAHRTLTVLPPLALMSVRTTLALVPLGLLFVIEHRSLCRHDRRHSMGGGGGGHNEEAGSGRDEIDDELLQSMDDDETGDHVPLQRDEERRRRRRRIDQNRVQVIPSCAILIKYIVPLGLLIGTAAGGLLFYGNSMAGAGKTAALQPALPVLVALLSYMLNRQKLSVSLVLGVSCTVVGALILAEVWKLWNTDIPTQTTTDTPHMLIEMIGTMILVLQVTVMAIYIIGFEIACERESSLTPMKSYFLMNLVGSTVNVILALATNELRFVDLMTLDALDTFTIFFGGFIVSGVCHALFSWSATKVSSTTSSVYVGAQAVWGELIAGVALDEGFQMYKIFGSVVIIAGVLMVATRKDTKPTAIGMNDVSISDDDDGTAQGKSHRVGDDDDDVETSEKDVLLELCDADEIGGVSDISSSSDVHSYEEEKG